MNSQRHRLSDFWRKKESESFVEMIGEMPSSHGDLEVAPRCMRVIVRLRKAAITCDALPVRCSSETSDTNLRFNGRNSMPSYALWCRAMLSAVTQIGISSRGDGFD